MPAADKIRRVMFEALIHADETHGDVKDRLRISIAEGGVVVHAIYDALEAAGMLNIEKPKPKKKKS